MDGWNGSGQKCLQLQYKSLTEHHLDLQLQQPITGPDDGAYDSLNLIQVSGPLTQSCCAGEDMHDLQLSAVLYDLAAEAGQGRQVGAAKVQLDISGWSEGQSHAQILTFLAADSAKVCKPLLHLPNTIHLIAVCCSIFCQCPF